MCRLVELVRERTGAFVVAVLVRPATPPARRQLVRTTTRRTGGFGGGERLEPLVFPSRRRTGSARARASNGGSKTWMNPCRSCEHMYARGRRASSSRLRSSATTPARNV